MTVAVQERPALAAVPSPPPVTAAPARRFGIGAAALDIRHMALPQIFQVCEVLSHAGDGIPKAYRGKKEMIFAAVMHGASLGLQPMAALQGIAIVEGQPTLSAALLGGLVMDAGHDLHVEYDDRQATATLTRSDTRKTTTVTWTLERARQANLCQLKDGRPFARSKNGNPLPWELYPAALLRSRSTAEACRAGAPDVLFGLGCIYTTEELGVVVDQDGLPVGGELERYELAEPPPGPSSDWLALAAKAESVDRLGEVWAGAHRDGAPDGYLDRLAAVSGERKQVLAREAFEGSPVGEESAGVEGQGDSGDEYAALVDEYGKSPYDAGLRDKPDGC